MRVFLRPRLHTGRIPNTPLCNFPVRTTLVLLLFIAGCGQPEPVIEYSLVTPPLILVPASTAGVMDGRARFREIYCAIQQDHGDRLPHDQPCENVLHRLGGESEPTKESVHLGDARLDLRILVVPGTLAECAAGLFSLLSYARTHLEEHGYKTGMIMVGGRTSSRHNATQIRDYLLSLDPPSPERIVLIGYSKGTPDILEAVVNHPEAMHRVAAVVSFAGVVGGTPIVEDLSVMQETLFKHFPMPGCAAGDAGAIESLKRSTRMTWLANNTLPSHIQFFSIPAFTERDRISSIIKGGYDTLATIDPRNDSQVIFFDAIIPGSTLLGYANADHWAIAVPATQDTPTMATTLFTQNGFPREVLLEAIVRYVEETLIEAR